MDPLMLLEHGEEERRLLSSDLAPHVHAWLQDSPLLHLQVKETLSKENKDEDQGKRLETKLRLLTQASKVMLKMTLFSLIWKKLSPKLMQSLSFLWQSRWPKKVEK